jgi:uncharacterized damage-inducible protein DinB
MHMAVQAESIGLVLLAHYRWKLQELHRRMRLAIEQASDADLNWRPNPQSHSIANLLLHTCGNIIWRFEHGIAGEPLRRDREGEFSRTLVMTVPEALQLWDETVQMADRILADLPSDRLWEDQHFRGRTVTLVEILSQCMAHYSEHLGQVLYVMKLRLGPAYEETLDPTK